MIGDKKKISSLKKICKKCNKPYKAVNQVISIFGNKVDKSYQVPTCNCIEIEEGRYAQKIAGQRIAAKIRRLKDCGINTRFKKKTFSNFDRTRDPNAYSVCRDYARDFGKNKKESLLLTGLAGTGNYRKFLLMERFPKKRTISLHH